MGHIAIVEVLISSWVSLEVLRTYSLTMGSWVSMDSRESRGRRWTPSDPDAWHWVSESSNTQEI